MKRLLLTFAITALLSTTALANGVAIVDVNNAIYLRLKQSEVSVQVENQVAIVTTTQVFKNIFNEDKKVKYGFPMPDGASATNLKFEIDGQWYEAQFAPTPADTSLPGPGGEIDPNLKTFLGDTPLYYDLEYEVKKDAILKIQLTYVQFLSYEFGKVDFYYQSDYRLIQTYPIDIQKLLFTLDSERTINAVEMIGITPDTETNDGNHAYLDKIIYESVPEYSYHIQYELSPDELGLFGMSTILHDTLVPDNYGSGFFTFIAEPDPGENTATINKVFTLIIDRSGSMYSDNKMVQARNAASFIVENLNEGDLFNIVDFSTQVSSFRPAHVLYNSSTESQALTYISGLSAGGGTNISGSFDTAIPQFGASTDSTANIIIFFTDGQATVGITDTDGILDHVTQLINQYETELVLYTFGIGSDVNKQLLTLLADENDGLSEFLGEDELEDRISDFYLTIRNPVLLSTAMQFTPVDIIEETYPGNLPNLYKGQQLLVSGRYKNPGEVTVKLSGDAFGKYTEYEYVMALSDTAVEKNRFLTKMWAKQKIEKLLIEYYSYEENSIEAEGVKQKIVNVSLQYGVISPFTKFSGGDPVGMEEALPVASNRLPAQYEILGNYPNPFNPSTTIAFRVNVAINDLVIVKIYNTLGQLVRILAIEVNGPSIYKIFWDGLLNDGSVAPSGHYFYIVDFGNAVLGGKMVLMK